MPPIDIILLSCIVSAIMQIPSFFGNHMAKSPNSKCCLFLDHFETKTHYTLLLMKPTCWFLALQRGGRLNNFSVVSWFSLFTVQLVTQGYVNLVRTWRKKKLLLRKQPKVSDLRQNKKLVWLFLLMAVKNSCTKAVQYLLVNNLAQISEKKAKLKVTSWNYIFKSHIMTSLWSPTQSVPPVNYSPSLSPARSNFYLEHSLEVISHNSRL